MFQRCCSKKQQRAEPGFLAAQSPHTMAGLGLTCPGLSPRLAVTAPQAPSLLCAHSHPGSSSYLQQEQRYLGTAQVLLAASPELGSLPARWQWADGATAQQSRSTPLPQSGLLGNPLITPHLQKEKEKWKKPQGTSSPATFPAPVPSCSCSFLGCFPCACFNCPYRQL